ncbi:hypothetical protein Tco_1067491 [Tanacetum coccineum]|uniref:Integrase zinc-binding domain-containing protein n=1 Tax=Tanacetum coccineum TaxID=301880 RepID=A0ABQ5HDX6_9ASTR
MIRRCVHDKEALDILEAAIIDHWGHHGDKNLTAKMIFDSGFLWLHFIRCHELVKNCDSCQRQGKISQRDEFASNSIQEKTKRKIHDAKDQNRYFQRGDQVLLFNSRLKIFSWQVESRWSPGIFESLSVLRYLSLITRESNPQLQLGIRYPNLID